MSFLTPLDVINEMLASLGESPLNTIDEGHPLTAAGLRMLRVANMREQAKTWWFNKELTTLTPDTSGYIYTPDDSIRVDPSDPALNYVQRGRRLYQPSAASSVNKYVFTQPVTCQLVRLIPFEELPPTFAVLVSYAAQLDFQKSYDADRMKFEQLKLDYQSALMNANAENIRNLNVNFLRRSSAAETLASIAPSRQLARYYSN